MLDKRGMSSEPLYSWVDVHATLYARVDEWPPALHSARAWWSDVLLTVTHGQRPAVVRWLAELFGPRFDEGAIRLEAVPDRPPRRLMINFDEVEGPPPTGRLVRTFTPADTIVRRRADTERDEPLPCPVLAFHSFKGGVGRTTVAIQLARAIAHRSAAPVVLVDMDFEAPGISWMMEEARLPRAPIAMSDVLAMIHGAGADELEDAFELIAQRLQDAQVDDLIILPALRPLQTGLDIRPEHLERSGHHSMADILSRLGRLLDAVAVVVDLRAGRSELAAGLLLDPRVSRALVTTAAGQSVRGTVETLSDLAQSMPTDAGHPEVTIVASRLSLPEVELGSIRAAVEDRLTTVLDDTTEDISVRFTATMHDEQLLALPLDWDEATERLANSISLDVSHLPLDLSLAQWAAEWTPTTGGVDLPLDDARKQLAEFARGLIHAEASGHGPFLDASFIRKLIEGHQSSLPRVVAIGAKGAGKTFTFLRLVEHQGWAGFARAAGMNTGIDGRVVPVAWAKNLRASAKKLLEDALDGTHSDTWLTRLREARDMRRSAAVTVTEWRDWWLDRFAEVIGLPDRTDLQRAERCLFIVDGIEDLLQEIHGTDPAEKRCLRALLQDVPAWLGALPRPCGLIVFARDDYVRAAIPQNTEQFRALYRPYELRWDRAEALRLVQWTAQQADVLPPKLDRDEALVKLWGRKLGTERSREGISEIWILDALSTRKDEVQARDLIRLLAESAEQSVDAGWEDRILAPGAIRDALEEVGKSKIDELKEERPTLGRALDRIRKLADRIRVPFTTSDLTTDEDKLALLRLEDAGIAWRDGEEIWLVSLYRRGLGLQLQPRRREKVLR